MPQMSPILWLNLYIVFTLTLVIFIAAFFFSKSSSQAPSPTKLSSKPTLNWTW